MTTPDNPRVSDLPCTVNHQWTAACRIASAVVATGVVVLGILGGCGLSPLWPGLLMVTGILIFSALVWCSAVSIHRRDARRQQAEALRESELLYHSLVEQMPQAVFRLDEAGRITFGNSHYCRLMGRDRGDLLGKTDFELFPAELAEKYWADSRRVMETGELRAANEELDSFAYAVSHDLRAPLRHLSGFSRTLLEDYAGTLPAEAGTILQEIDLASHHMGQLIDGLLGLSRSTRGELRRDAVDLTALASRVLGRLAAAEPQRAVTWSVEPGMTVWGDARMLDVVLSNLLDNAWKYTGKALQAVIRVYRGPTGGDEEICVADNGDGFDLRHAARLFQPFHRLHREDEYPGIGLGLATVYRIIQRHGGTLHAVAAPGQGATFSFRLPRMAGGEERS